MEIKDTQLIARIIKLAKGNEESLFTKKAKDASVDFENIIYPLDSEILKDLNELLSYIRHKSNSIYQKASEVRKIWTKLIEKSIICLRYFDSREPFIDNKTANKKPTAYGIDELNKYFEAYDEFEGLLYGSNKYYRDHLILSKLSEFRRKKISNP